MPENFLTTEERRTFWQAMCEWNDVDNQFSREDWANEILYEAVSGIVQRRLEEERGGEAAIHQSNLRTLSGVVREISDQIDSTYPPDLDQEAHLLRRVVKIAEEAGEAIEALFGVLGENARKGQTHTMDDVRRELLDVALAALAAIAHFDDFPTIDRLDQHARAVLDRLAAVTAGAR